LLAAAELPHDGAAAWFEPGELSVVEAALARRVNAPITTSVGRLFDAVAALVGLRGRSRFEAEAAMELEQIAIDEPLDVAPYPLPIIDRSPRIMDWRPLILAILDDLHGGTPVARIAARFHAGLAEAASAIVERSAVRDVALCGGCFQNARLVETVTHRLEALGATVWIPRELPPGDGALAVGQALLASRRSRDVSCDSR
jgi:hydrogenase maturation protein HypF